MIDWSGPVVCESCGVDFAVRRADGSTCGVRLVDPHYFTPETMVLSCAPPPSET